MTTRIYVDEYIDEIDIPAMFNGCSLVEASARILEIQNMYPGAELTIEADWHGSRELSIIKRRLENDAEYAARIKKEQKVTQKEYKEYLKLKAKFESDK